MRALVVLCFMTLQMVFGADAPAVATKTEPVATPKSEPVVAAKAEFLYPDFSQCYEKNKPSIVYFGKTRAVAISEKQAIAYSKEKPTVPYAKHDPLSNLYLFDSEKPLIPVKLKSPSELKLGEWLGSMNENALIVVNSSKIGLNSNDLFEFGGSAEANNIISGLCCEMLGLGVGDKYFISSDALKHFIDVKMATYSEIGARVSENNESVIVDFVDPNFKNAKLKAGDKIISLNGKNIKTLAEFNEAFSAMKSLPKVSAQIQRDNSRLEENIIAPKVVAKKAEPKKVAPVAPKKEPMMKNLGFNFNKELHIIDIAGGSFADKSGLKIGDRLMQIDGQSVNSPAEIDAYFAKSYKKEHRLLFDRDDFQFFVNLKR